MEKKKYKHIDKTERKEIALLLGKGYGCRDVARALGRSPGTISEEIDKNSVRGSYDPEKAAHKAYLRRHYSKYQGMKVAENDALRHYVEERLTEDWSPEEIAGRIQKVDTHVPYASRNAIYKFIYSVYGRNLECHLRYYGKRKKSYQPGKSAKLQDRIFIDQRPKIVAQKRRFGDWEGDFIVSGKNGKGVLLVLHERKARYVLIKKITNPTIELVHRLMWEMTGGYIVNTVTLDNDLIFRKHRELSQVLGAPVYFCHPYHSWEKGTIENTNKYIRKDIPKGSDLSRYSKRFIRGLEAKLNRRYMQCLTTRHPERCWKRTGNEKSAHALLEIKEIECPN